MSEDIERTPLGTIEAFEATAFRIGQVARQLLAEHPDLPVSEIRPFAVAYRHTESAAVQLDISTYDTDAVHAWADVLGATVDVRFHDDVKSIGHCFEHHEAEMTISGVKVSFGATRQPAEEEVAAWRSKRDQAAVEESSAAPAGDAG